jgi:hypothetical protein
MLAVRTTHEKSSITATPRSVNSLRRTTSCDSLMNNDGVLRANNVIKHIPDQSVVQLRIGDSIRLTAEQFERLAAAFFAELERKFL